MDKTKILILLLFSILSSCQSEKMLNEKQGYLRWVGDIEHNDKLDETEFKVCNEDDKIIQYFNLGEGPVYSGEKSTILKTFNSKYKASIDNDQNGLIRIRFVVNCEGKVGRLRVLQSDYNYQKKEFDKRIISQLVDITKGIENWEIRYLKEMPIDYYMYLIFKIRDGQLIEILP